MITVLTFKAIGFPTILGKTDTKSKREIMSNIYSFKRMFPNYSFTRLELDFIRQLVEHRQNALWFQLYLQSVNRRGTKEGLLVSFDGPLWKRCFQILW